MAGCWNRLQNLQKIVDHVLKFGSSALFLVPVDNANLRFVRTVFVKSDGCKYLLTRRTFVSGLHCVQKLHSNRHDKNVKAVEEAEIEELKRKFEDVINKIMYNTVLEFSKSDGNWKKKKVLMDKEEKLRISKINEKDAVKDIPVALKYLKDAPEIHKINGDEVGNLTGNETVCLPYSIETELDATVISKSQDYESKGVEILCQQILKSPEMSSSSWTQLRAKMLDTSVSAWMSDYECYDESEDVLENSKPWEVNYGTPDVNIPLSDVPCGGCGAVLHCQVSFCTQ
jgi:hypothetical protein